ncbi:nitroreductase family protein [Oenococcus oeni]|uniref:nitroreductase family protein n=1 Tax=Oenococcus oeni TaxID=1247 RepID=UPI00050F3C23|nr:nitroreductase family protein [Oenococcus oeni]KGI00234.1 nitroreductase [Oenococcus oeni IOEB_C52]
MNDLLKVIHNRASIRKFTGEHIPESDMEQIMSAAQSVPSINNYQPVTYVEITDQSVKDWAADLVNMPYVASSDRFFVILADYHKLLVGFEGKEREIAQTNLSAYNIAEGAALSAGVSVYAAIIAAESLGYGGVTMAGPVRAFQIYENYLDLPEMTKVVFTLALGVPDGHPGVKPKLPLSTFWQKDSYDTNVIDQGIADYNQTMRSYYESRNIDENWTEHNKKALTKAKDTTALTEYAKRKGFNLK